MVALVRESDQAQACAASQSGVRLFVGGHGHRFGSLLGDRCYSPAHPVNTTKPSDPRQVIALLDSGAFSDGPADRLTPAEALRRQLTWERHAAAYWGAEGWRARYLVSYDHLVDETWTPDGTRHKRRWTVEAAERAVEDTVEAAAYLSSQRAQLCPRRLVLACQGVDPLQYDESVAAVVRYAVATDWIGLGGWCILGRYTSWLPTFWATLHLILPRIAEAGIGHVHIFGVLYLPALGGLLWLADEHGLTVSTDSSAPTRSASVTTERARKKAGARAETWEGNVEWWHHALATLRRSAYYRPPARIPAVRQTTLWD